MVYVHPLLRAEYIKFVESGQKPDVLKSLIDVISKSPNITNRDVFQKAVFDRESIMSTGIGLGIAIPHVKIPEIKDMTIAVGISKQGIEWDALDGQPVHIIFLIAGSADQHDLYLRTLSKIVLVLKNPARREKITAAVSAEEVIRLFQNV
ncbi:PTS sugar transporter subunit IIA [bacterium]|nr:PTS sugar transporter subunit IIA [bacterium]